MPVNRNALIRFRTIDNCLRNRYRKWTLEDLIRACSDSLYEYEGIDKGVSRRTVQMDIQFMRSDKLGYNAPIVVSEKKFYSYENQDYSITNIPLTDQDLGKLSEVADILRQFKGFSHFNELNGMVQRLEDRIHTAKTKQAPVIDLEKNEGLKGLEHIDTLYQSIIKKYPVSLTYKPFRARGQSTFTFHAYYLKEYRNRWFVLGIKSAGEPVLTLALDRIVGLERSYDTYLENTSLNLSDHFRHVVGVTVDSEEPPQIVELFIDHTNAPYVLTKPIHHSQEVLEQNGNGITIRLRVQVNFELTREILGFGDSAKVLRPEKLKQRIRETVYSMHELYEKDLQRSEISEAAKKVRKRGYVIIDNVYTQKEQRRILSALNRAIEEDGWHRETVLSGLLLKIPSLSHMLFNANLRALVRGLENNYFLTRTTYFDNHRDTALHQDRIIHVNRKTEAPGFTKWKNESDFFTVIAPDEYLQSAFILRIYFDDAIDANGALHIVPKTHFTCLTSEQIAEAGEPKSYSAGRGGLIVYKPLVAHAATGEEKARHMRVIELEFNNQELPGNMDWAERVDTLS